MILTKIRYLMTVYSLLLWFVLLSGCNQKTALNIDQPQAQKLAGNVANKEVKPGAAIKIVSEKILYLPENRLIDQTIVLSAPLGAAELTADFVADAGIDLINMGGAKTFALNSSGQVSIPLTIKTSVRGRFYLNLQASLSADDVLSRHLTLILQVGPEDAPSQQRQKDSNENTVVLPAQEAISNP